MTKNTEERLLREKKKGNACRMISRIHKDGSKHVMTLKAKSQRDGGLRERLERRCGRGLYGKRGKRKGKKKPNKMVNKRKNLKIV